jgi:hypothetical protein
MVLYGNRKNFFTFKNIEIVVLEIFEFLSAVLYGEFSRPRILSKHKKKENKNNRISSLIP